MLHILSWWQCCQIITHKVLFQEKLKTYIICCIINLHLNSYTRCKSSGLEK
jgi:hypothetical protein